MRAVALLIPLMAVIAASCGDRGHAPVPRRTAYPRMQLLDTVMRSAEVAPGCSLAVNACAETVSPRPGWLTISYPLYGATMYVTVTETNPATVDEIKANRMERVLLNAGGLPGRQSEWINPAGMSVMTLRTDGSTTPLQFLATDDSSTVISGALYFADASAATATDSIAPAVNAVEGDVRRMLNLTGDE